MDVNTSCETKDCQNNKIHASSYSVNVVPIEFSRNRLYNTQKPEFKTEQYNEFAMCNQEEFKKPEEPSKQAPLYSVSQRIPQNSSYSSLCLADGNYVTETNAYNPMPNEWERDRTENNEDPQENFNEKKKIGEYNSNEIIVASESIPKDQMNNSIIPTCLYLHNRVAILMEIEDTKTATCDLICKTVVYCEELAINKQISLHLFALWITSPLLELQLKPTQKPFEIWQKWANLIKQYSHASYSRQMRDEPILKFKRNVLYPQHLEEKVKDQKILELLYEEAKDNILGGRYPCEVAHYIMLGGIQARIELGTYNPQVHSIHYFRDEQAKYLPPHVRKSATWSWLPISSKNSAEVRLFEQFKRIPSSATNRKLIRKYLEFCWSLPFYGSAFFEGQLEQPIRGLMSLMIHQDIPVLIAINMKGIYIIDDINCTILLGLRYEELSWEYAKPSKENDPNCLPCLFIQFLTLEAGVRVSKILQVFSKQAILMESLITTFVNRLKSKSAEETNNAPAENQITYDNDANSTVDGTSSNTPPSLANKLNKLTLATFDEDGHCIGQMGSWSFSR